MREYDKTNWVCHKTPVNSENLNKIEDAIEELYNTSIDISQLKAGKAMEIDITDDKEIEVGVNPDEINAMVKHRKFLAGDGIILEMEDKKPPFPIIRPDDSEDDKRFDEHLGINCLRKKTAPPKPIKVSVNNDYINEIVEHPTITGEDGIIVNIIEPEPEPLPNPEEVGENEYCSEDMNDVYVPKKQPTINITTDLDYIDENITHPEYFGIRGVKIIKPIVETIFPEHGFDERAKVVLLDEDYINDYAIDVDKLAKKLELSPIITYSAGYGIKIDEKTEEEDDEASDDTDTTEAEEGENPVRPSESVEPGKAIDYDTFIKGDLTDPIDNSEIELEDGETIEDYLDKILPDTSINNPVEKIEKVISINEEDIKNTILDNSPTVTVGEGLSASYSVNEDDKVINTEISVDPEVLKETLGITKHPELYTHEGILCDKDEDDNYHLSIDAHQLRYTLGVTDHPEITVGKGILMNKTYKTVGSEVKEMWEFNVDPAYINSIVEHKKYKFAGNYFNYSEQAGIGLITINETKLRDLIQTMINSSLKNRQ